MEGIEKLKGKVAVKDIYVLYQEAFPPSELQPWDNFQAMAEDGRTEIFGMTVSGNGEVKSIAALIAIPFEQYAYVPYLAVAKEYRNRKIGTPLFKQVMDWYWEKGIITIGEVELPETEMAARRLRAYERLGVNVNEFPYTMPDFQTGDVIQMYPISYPRKLTEEEWQQCGGKMRGLCAGDMSVLGETYVNAI